MTTTSSTTSPLAALRVIATDIRLAHSVFALPFALLAAFMAAAPKKGSGVFSVIEWPRFAGQLALIVLAMIFARTVAMLANRLLDREIDRANPRTAGRALPSGRLSPRAAIGALVISALLFMAVCLAFGALHGNWWPALLALPVLIWLSAYPLLKRFTALCHLYLGASLAISPLAAAIAVDPAQLPAQPALWLIAAMVLLWVAGFDIIYALQDIDIDRAAGLHSIPGRVGAPGAVRISRVLHVLAGGSLIAAAIADARFGVLFGAGAAMVLLLLIFEHCTVARWGTGKIALAVFTLNGLISCTLGGLGIADILIGP